MVSIRKRAIVILTMFAFFYALLELGMNWDPSQCLNSPAWMRNLFNSTISFYFYRVIYDGLFLSIVYSITGKLISWETLWYFIYASTVEDIFYWVIGLEVPRQWAWFYPVIYGIPIDDIIGIILLVVLKNKIRK